jgi:hypothetical protein
LCVKLILLTNKSEKAIFRHTAVPSPVLELVLTLLNPLLRPLADGRHVILIPTTDPPLAWREAKDLGAHTRFVAEQLPLVSPLLKLHQSHAAVTESTA